MTQQSFFEWAAEALGPARAFEKPEALAGIRVLELATLILGPFTATLLGELGAEVIKVELPGAGDTMRSITPRARFWKNASLGWLHEARNKYHVAIDIHRREGQELFRRLAARSDVVVENLRAGTMERKFGIGYRQLRELNPRLIYVANTGFGQWGPFSVGRASYDAVAQAVSGMAAITGFPDRPPLKSGIFIGDYYGALLSAVAVLAALHHRDVTGEGQFIDLSQSENLIRSLDWTWLYHGLTGHSRGRHGNRDVAISPAGIFRCQDGMVAIGAATDAQFQGLCRAIGREDLATDPRFATPLARLEDPAARALQDAIAAWAEGRAAAEVDALGAAHGFAAAPVMNAADHYADPHLRARGAVWRVDDPIYGEVVEYGPVPKMSGTPPRITWAGKPVGLDNEFVLTTVLGLPRPAVKALEAAGVIGRWKEMPGRKPPDGWKGEGAVLPGPPDAGPAAPGQAPPAILEEEEARPQGAWEEWARQQTDPARAWEKPEALAGLRVLDLSHANLAGCFCASILAEFGAEVIRVEPPGGDVARSFTPFGILHRGTGLGYLGEGRNKYHITLSLGAPDGREILAGLARRADVLIETFLPGTMDAWGIGYRQLAALNPRLIYLALYTYGQFGPRAGCGKPDLDVADQALSGVPYLTGEPEVDGGEAPSAVPTKQGPWHAWYAGGGFGALAILAALHHRQATGEGQFIDVSPAEAEMRFADFNLLWYHAERRCRERVGNLDTSVFPYTFLRCKDGYAFIAGFTDPNWAALTTTMGRPDLREKYPAIFDRLDPEKQPDIHRELEAWALQHTADEILTMVQKWPGPGVMATSAIHEPGKTVAEANWWERGAFQRLDDPTYGQLLIQAPPWKMTGTPPRLKWACRPVGADNEYVYQKILGLGPSRLAALRAQGII